MAALTHPIQVLLVAMLGAHLALRPIRKAWLAMHGGIRGRVDEITQRV